jgi:hypothetical protein
LTELIAKYYAIQALKIAEVNAFGKQSETVGDGSPQVPGIGLKQFQRLLVHAPDVLPSFSRVAIDEVFHQ